MLARPPFGWSTGLRATPRTDKIFFFFLIPALALPKVPYFKNVLETLPKDARAVYLIRKNSLEGMRIAVYHSRSLCHKILQKVPAASAKDHLFLRAGCTENTLAPE